MTEKAEGQRGEAERFLADLVRLLAVAREAGLVNVVEALEAARAEAERLIETIGVKRLDS